MRPDETPGGPWLTYRYRVGGDGAAEAAGTIKAPSFLSAARRLVAGRLAGRIGPGFAYLRLRAAGEQEVLVRVDPTHADVDGAPHVDVVPSDSYRFAEHPGPDASARDSRTFVMPQITTADAAAAFRGAVAALSARLATDYGDLVPDASAARTAAVAARLEAGAAPTNGRALTTEELATLDSWIRLADSAVLHDDPTEAEARAELADRLRAVRTLVEPASPSEP